MTEKKQKTIGFEKRPVKEYPEEADIATHVSGSSLNEWWWENWTGKNAKSPEAKR